MLKLLTRAPSLLDNLDNYYQEFLKYGVYTIDDANQHSLKDILEELTEEEVENIKKEMNNIQEKYLYKSKIHGIYHSEKVVFWSYILGRDNAISKEDERILLDASKYHDIGRTNDIDDTIHGRVSALKIGNIVKDSIYEQAENKNLLYAIIELHSLDDKMENKIAQKYHLLNNTRFPILWRILKDADALDRIRYDLGYLDEFSFNPVYLRMKTSSYYIKASYELCTYYKKEKKENISMK